MSEKEFEKERYEFQGELSGSMAGLRSGTMITEQIKKETLLKEQKKQRQNDVSELLLDLCEQAFSSLMEQIERDLQAVRVQMEENRNDWDRRANRLEAIDEVLEAVKNGKALNKAEAQKIIQSAGLSVPDNATNADYYTLLVAIKTDDLEHIEVLDNDFRNLEKNEQFYLNAKTKANAIHNDENLDTNQKLAAYEGLNSEISKADFAQNAYHTKSIEQKSDAEIISKNDYGQKREDFAYDISGLNF